MIKIPHHIETFWRSFLDSESCPDNANELFLESFQIGSSINAGNVGAQLILSGEKTATSSLLWEIEVTGGYQPTVGTLSVVEDGNQKPLCVIQTTWVKVIPFCDVDADFARDYSETDGTIESWRKVFGEYYAEVCESMGRKFSKDTPLVCERFEVIFS